MAFYASHHQHPLNRLTHYFGVPLIMFSLFVPLSWVKVPVFEVSITGAVLLVTVVVFYYLLLDVALAIASAFLSLLLVLAGHYVAGSFPPGTGWSVFAACFIGGWILQFVGHIFEGRRPALFTNVWQIFVAPIFLVAEAFFALGLKKDVKERIKVQQTD